ncbi:hypothetical protein KKC13_11815 [bacterium]|nr:hypothetical protein [bacterium]MBU1958645.1 hypothetical protein [bacterium]
MKYTFLILSALILTACSPRYEIKTHYTPPTNLDGKVCVQTCSNDKKTCQRRCNQKEDQCLATAEQSARDSYPAIMHEYQNLQSQYLYALDRYNIDMDAWEHQRERLRQDVNHYRHKCKKDNAKSYECRRANEADDQLRHMYRSEPTHPIQPVQPTLSDEIQLAQRACHNECGCNKIYDTCFSSCGGTLTYEKFCVENCD